MWKHLSRRTALRGLAGLGALTMTGAGCSPSTSGSRRLGAEWEPQERTFLSWPTEEIWAEQIDAVRRDIADLASVIAEFQPVVLLARPESVGQASRAVGRGVEVVSIPVDDLWARDTLPVFVEESGRVQAVDLNFNGWGEKQYPHDADAAAAAAVSQAYELAPIGTWLTGEAGALETDGQGTLLATESPWVNDNRNPGASRDDIETELMALLGMSKVIWFDGVRGEDITDAHIDCLVRFTAPGTVLLDTPFPGAEPDVWSRCTDQARTVLAAATDARDRPLRVVELPQPDPDLITGGGEEFLSTYLNFAVANGAVFVPAFGDVAADDTAVQILGEHFPGREIVPVSIDAVAGGGGGIHCATHDQPAD